MNLRLKFRWMDEKEKIRSFILQQLKELDSDNPASTANILVERQTANSPWVWVWVRLVVPGPDLRIVARDYTFLAAWLKAIKALRRKIKQRKARQRLAIEPVRSGPCGRRPSANRRTIRT